MPLNTAYGDGSVTVFNSSTPGTLYIRGSEFEDLSERIRMDELTDVPEVQRREDEVWNPGEFQVAQGSLLLGREIRISAAGHHLVVNAPDFEDDHIVVAQDFTDEGTRAPESSKMGALQVRVIRQSDNSEEHTSTAHETLLPSPDLVISKILYIQTGTTGASADVSFVMSEGIPPNDIVFFKKNFPSSKFPANSEIVLDISPGVQFTPGIQINAFFNSPNAFTLRHATGGGTALLWFAIDLQKLVHENMVVETFILAEDLRICFNNAGELVRGNPVFV